MTPVRVIFHRLADDDYRRARAALRRRSPLLRAQFVQAVRDAADWIAANPSAGSPIFVDYRWVKTKRFKYLLHYRQLAPDLVLVYAVAHASRRPGYWLRRTRVP